MFTSEKKNCLINPKGLAIQKERRKGRVKAFGEEQVAVCIRKLGR